MLLETKSINETQALHQNLDDFLGAERGCVHACMRTWTLRAQAKQTLPQLSRVQVKHGFCQNTVWHAQVQQFQVSAPCRKTRRLNARTSCSVHNGFHQQRLAADVRTGTKSADFKPLAVEIRSDFSLTHLRFRPGFCPSTSCCTVWP